MEVPGTGELVLVHLLEAESPDEGAASRAVSVPGICDALEVGAGSVAGRVRLLSTLSELGREGLVEEEHRPVEGVGGERNVYRLTGEGRERARAVRDRVIDRRVLVRRSGGGRKRRLGDVDLPPPALVRALARLTDDGVVYAEESVEERFVDRETELSMLSGALDRVLDGDGVAVLVSGEAGVGKTTVVSDRFADRAREAGASVHVGRCREGESEPYAPFRSALAELLDRGDDPFDRGSIAPGDGASYGTERTAMFESVAELVENAADGPAVLVVDDLHAADGPTVALFDHLVDHTPPGVLVVGTYRPEDLPDAHPLSGTLDGWANDESRVPVDLDPFERSETRGLVEWTVGRRGVPASFVDLVHDHTGGNPLFVTEAVNRLVETGAVDPEHGIYPEDPDAVPLSDRVEETVEIRLSTLDDDTREVLWTGALVGGRIPFGVLAAATDIAPPELREHVDLLVDARVWKRMDRGSGDARNAGGEPNGGSDPDLRFVSGLVRETAVDRVPDGRRADLHARVADAIADREAGDPDRHAAVAYHRARAGEWGDAFEEYVRAGDRATDVYAHEVALDNYDRALGIARDHLDRSEDGPDLVAVLESVGDVHYLLGEYDEADRYYRYVRDRVEAPDTERRIARIRADIRKSRGSYREGLEVVEDAIENHGVSDTRESARLFAKRGALHSVTGEYDAGEAAYERAREIAERVDDPDAIATAYLDLGALDVRRGEVDSDTVSTLERAVETAREGEDDRTLGRALNNLAMVHRKRGEFDAAERLCRERLELQEAIGDVVATARARKNLAWILQTRGEFEEAHALQEEAIETADHLDNPDLGSRVHVDAGLLSAARTDLEAAAHHFRQCVDLAADVDRPRRRAIGTLDLADTELDRGDFAAAREAGREAHEIATREGIDVTLAATTAVLGAAARRTGDGDRARELLREGIHTAEDADDPLHEAENRAILAELLRDDGDLDAALDQARRAAEAAETADGPGIEATARIRLGTVHRAREEYDRAADSLAAAVETVRAGDPDTGAVDRVELCRALLERARLARDRGDHDAAREDARETHSVVEEYGIGRYREETGELVGELERG